MADPLAKQRKGGGAPEGDDAFIEAIYRSWGWIQRNARAVVVGLVVVGLGLLGFFYYRSYQRNVEERAAVQLQELRTMALDDAEAASRLESHLRQFGGTEAGQEARVLLGRLHLGAGRYDAAIEVLEPIARRPADSPLGYAARQLRAAALEGQGATERALEELATLGQRARYAFQRRAARAEQARILVEGGRLEEAERIYAELVEATENAGERAMYRVRLGEVRGMLASGGSPAAEDAADGEEAAAAAANAP